jgi:TonB-linked SusC/RagA family outer membrane protein
LIRGQGNKDGDGIAYVVDGILGARYNVNDIETITVLKDAASASIYGASAGTGGVVLITTKKAKLGKVNVNLNVQRGFQEGYNLPTALTAEEYNQVYKQAAVNSGKAEPDRTNNLLNPWGAVTRTDWMEEVFRRGLVENYGINISGGNEDLNLYASFNYQNKEGILLNTFSKKFSGKLTGVFRYNDNIKLTQTLQIRQDESRSANTTSGYSGVIVSAYYMPSSAPVYDEFGNFHGTTPSNIGYGYGDVINPVASLLRNDSENPTTNFYSSTRLELKLPLGFKFESSFAIDGYQRYYSSFSPKRLEKGKQDEENSRSMSALNNYDWVMDNVLKYDKSFLGNNISVILGYNSSYEKNQNFGLQVYGYDKEDDYYRMLGNATNWTKSPPSEGYVELSQAAMFSRLAYDYKKRYFLIASARQDKSSRLHPDYNTDEFYSFAASWNVTNESFIKSLDIDDILSYLKLRISWGQIGNVGSVPVYHYAVDASNLGDGIILGADPKVLNGVAFQKIPNEELRWETGEQIDYGFDAVLFNSLDLKFDYFKKTTKDLIDDIPQTKMQGAKYTTKGNVGEVTNSGYEISINYSGKIAEVEYAIGGNLSYVKNEVDKLGQSVILHGNDFRGLYPLQSEVGQEWYSYKLIKTDGIFQSDQEAEQYVDKNGNRIQPEAKAGDLKFVDENGDGKIDGLDKVYLGNSVPDYSYAINAKIAYKGIDFSIMLQGVAEAKIFNAMKNTTHNLSVQEYNRSNEVLNAWSPDNTGSDLPMVRLNDPNGNFSKESDFYLEDGDYLRIKNITLGYSFPKEIKDMLNLKKLRIYLSAENLATFTDYNGIDPEVGNNGIDSGRYPVAKSFLVGLNINF